MKSFLIISLLALISFIAGCEGMLAIRPTYKPTSTGAFAPPGSPLIKLQVRDGRENKVFCRSPGYGEITDDGRGGPFRLEPSLEEIFEYAFTQALQECGYQLSDNAQIEFHVSVEKFLLIVHPPDDPIFGIGNQGVDIVLNIRAVSGGQILAAKRVIQSDTPKSMLEPPGKLLTASLTSAVQKAIQDSEMANAIGNEHYRIRDRWETVLSVNTVTAYRKYIKEYPDSYHAGKAAAKIVDLEVDEIMRQRHGNLPPLREMERIRSREYSVINIHNDTSHRLTIRYSGPDSLKVIFKPGEKASIELLKGNYRLVASVDTEYVQNYVSKETLTGGNYQVRYYIVTTSALGPALPKIPSSMRTTFEEAGSKLPKGRFEGFTKFNPWPTKRKLPQMR